ncbi:MAG TPA: hypothetical protein DCM02_09535 [Flavobacterium sp.]|nr:hypothetical protein [Flavobacterium sp.]HAT76981.1 hypothetical protein [Flavobacterium sp.]
MKKLILTFIAMVGFAFTSQAQCDSQSTLVNTGCGTVTCLSVEIPLTGYLEVDSANYAATGGTMRRKPSLREALDYAAQECP